MKTQILKSQASSSPSETQNQNQTQTLESVFSDPIRLRPYATTLQLHNHSHTNPSTAMIHILFTLIFAEMALIVIFVFKTPLRKLVILGLDRVKRGQAPIVVKAVGSTIFVVMMSTVYSVMRIRNRRNGDDAGDGELTPTDQILAARHLLEASLMGFSLFLALMIDRLHHYIRELRIRRKNMEAIKKQNRIIENGKNGSQDEAKALEGEVNALKEKITHLQTELDAKTKEASDAEANAIALKKQSEGFLLEYDRLLEDNQNLRAQLQSSDRR